MKTKKILLTGVVAVALVGTAVGLSYYGYGSGQSASVYSLPPGTVRVVGTAIPASNFAWAWGCLINHTPQAQITYPAGGETFYSNQAVTLKWKTCNIPAGVTNVNFEYFQTSLPNMLYGLNTTPQGSSSYSTSSPNTGQAVYYMPDTQYGPSGSNFKLALVINGLPNGGRVLSNGTFTLLP